MLRAVAGECSDESHIRKVEAFNDAYRLKEKGAVLNWFDITETEGHFSLNDTIAEIMSVPEGRQLFNAILQSMMASDEGMQMAFKPEDMGKMMQMMGSFTVLRMIGLMGAAGKKVSKEQLLALNAQLNQIQKPQK